MAKDWTRTKAYRDLAAGLRENLDARGLIEPVYRDLLDRYLELWCEFQELSADIRERGVCVEDPKRSMLVENRSCTIRHQTSQKMIDIYNALGFREISAGAARGLPDDDEL